MSWELPTTKSGHWYILTIHLLIKYSVAIKQTLLEIADALIEKFIDPYIPPKALITDQDPNFISSMMCHIVHKYKISTYKTTA